MFYFLKIENKNLRMFLGLLIIIIGCSTTAYSYQYLPKDKYMDSQISETKFDEGVWKNTISGIDYSSQPAKKKKKKKEPRESSSSGERTYESESYTPPSSPSNFWSGFFKFFLIALAVIIIAVLIANLVGVEGWTFAPTAVRKAQEKQAVPITLENIEENIYESDLDRFIREALEKRNYSQAVRLYYLAIIKELSLKRWIKWKKDKTNRDYIRELSNTNFQNNFRNVTRMFERVWYGKQKLEDADFHNSIQPQLKNLLQDSQKASKKI